MTHFLRVFLHNTRGNVTVMLAIAMIPLFAAAGAAIDYLRLFNVKADIQSAIDGAAMAAAIPRDASEDQRIAIAKDYFRSNMKDYEIEIPDIEVKVTAETVQASVKTTLPTSFMRVAGFEAMKIDEFAEVIRPFAGRAEVALVLDYSKSMEDNDKFKRMAAAAAGMIDALDAKIDDAKLKIGLVPFSGMVYTSISKTFVTQASASATWTGCTQDRRYPHNTGVATPSSDVATKWGYFDNTSENTGQFSCSAYQSKGLKVIPLTTDIATVKSKLSAMRPVGYTNIALGAEFGWNLLDPALPYDEGQPYTDKNNRKFIVLLTDGVQTSKHWGSGNSRTVNNAGPNLLSLCEGMRESKITIFTIAYDIDDPKVTTLLSECSPGRYFEPDASGAEISAVFSQITQQIQDRIARISK